MSAPPTTVSTPRLSEVARHLVLPQGIVTSVFPRIEKRLNAAGVFFDPWQQGLSTAALGCRADGKYAATVGGVVMSIPRQVGKTYTVGNLIIGLCLEFPGAKWIWTSHHNRTNTNTFRLFQSMVNRKAIRPHLKPNRSNGIRSTNGEQEIEFRNGSMIQFGARAQGFGRGLDGIDGEVFDEAQILGIKALEDMVPATNQAQHPHGGLIFFMGTPPRPTDEGEAFTSKRQKAIDGKTVDQMYVEFSPADANADPFDTSIYPSFNPSFPLRTPLEAMQRMLENIPDEDSIRREMMGIWPKFGVNVFSYERWLELKAEGFEHLERAALAVAVAQDRSWACIAAAGESDGKTAVMCFSVKGVSGVAAKVLELTLAQSIIEVGLAGAQARALAPDFVRADIEFELLTGGDEAAACVAFQEAVKAGSVVHRGDGQLNLAVKNAQTRMSGESERWDRRDPKVDDSPLVACSAALYRWGLKFDPNYDILESIL
jgi:hypothetical protein